MSRPVRPTKVQASQATDSSLAAGRKATWPWSAEQVVAKRAPDRVDVVTSAASAFAATADTQAKFVANWIAQIHAAQLVGIDLAKTLPATLLVPFGWRLNAPAPEVTNAQDDADSAAASFASSLSRLATPMPWLYWINVAAPLHVEEVVA